MDFVLLMVYLFGYPPNAWHTLITQPLVLVFCILVKVLVQGEL